MKELFKKYYNSVLSPEEFERFSQIIQEKQNESELFEEIRQQWDKNLKNKTGLPSPNPALMEKIKDSVLISKHRAAQRKLKIYKLVLGIAAILIIGLMINTFFFSQNSVKSQFKNHLQTITTPAGARTSTVLPDGSRVWLNSASSLSFPTGFEQTRPVSLTGEAFFEVTDKNIPFIVSTKLGEVEVSGTAFNVKAIADDNSFETTLVKGVVIVRAKDTKGEMALKPGQQAVHNFDGFHVKNVETNRYISWKDGKLIFSKEPFPEFIKRLERWYNVKIEYSDPQLDDLCYTGTFEMETISEVMEKISREAPVKCSYNNKTRIFTIAQK